MKTGLSCGIFATALIVLPAVEAEGESGVLAGGNKPTDPIGYIRRALQTYPIVCLAEGGHQALQPHLFLRRVLGDKTILRTVDVIIVEFAATRHQAVLDAYIRGEDVPFSKLSAVWRNTGQSPHAPWDSPLYHELLKVIRKGNLTLSQNERVRVVAGDPPIEWENIKTREDFNKSRVPRDLFVTELAVEQAIHQKQRVLIIFGGAHLPRVPVGPEDDGRNSLTCRILKKHPRAVKTIGFLDPVNLGITERIDSLVRDKIYVTADHWVGAINAELVFPGTYSLVTDAKTGERSWQQIPLYSGHSVRDLFDALVYIGPSSEWEYVPASFDKERDGEYLKELNRRSLLRFGRSLNSDE